jgi:hypothetical protein
MSFDPEVKMENGRMVFSGRMGFSRRMGFSGRTGFHIRVCGNEDEGKFLKNFEGLQNSCLLSISATRTGHHTLCKSLPFSGHSLIIYKMEED